MVCWLVCAGWVCGTRTFLNAVWCFGCIEMDWLACDCVYLFWFPLFDPVGLRGLLFFLCSNFFGRQHELFVCCALGFVVVCSFVGFRAFHGLFRMLF